MNCLEKQVLESNHTKQEIMHYNISKVKTKRFLGYVRSFFVWGYYKIFEGYNGKKKN